MDRRTACRVVGATVVGLAGCGGSSGSSTDSSPTTEGSTGTTGSDSVAARSVEAPSTVEVGQSFDVEVTVENTADAAAQYRSTVSYHREGGDWQRIGRLERSIEPGRTRTLTATLPGIAFLGTYRFRLDRSGRTWTTESTPRELTFGSEFVTPRRVGATVLGGNFTDTYEVVNSTETLTPPGDDRWLLVRVEFRNPTDGQLQSAPFSTFSVRAGDEEYGVRLSDPGRRVTMGPQDRSRVELPFVVPRDLTVDDVGVWWRLAYSPGDTAAVWRA